MSDFPADDIARSLLDASAHGTPIAPVSETFPGLSVEQAYTVQELQVRSWAEAGRTVRGYKVGLTSAAMQRQLGVDQPDFGHLMADMFYGNAQAVDTSRLISPKIEPEFAFVLGHDLAGPDLTVADAARAVKSVCGALEVIDSRIKDWKITLADTVADNASCGAVVLGDRHLPLEAVELRTEGVLLHRDGELVATGAGAAVLGSPLAALTWLANTLGSLGTTLKAGSVVLPGSMTAAVPVRPGSTVTATYASFGTVTANFTA